MRGRGIFRPRAAVLRCVQAANGNSMRITRDQFVRLAMEQLDGVDRVARSLSRDGAAANDLVQETYLRAMRAQDQFDLHAFGIRPWLLRILHNTHMNREKRERRQPRAMESDALEASTAPVESAPLSPPRRLEPARRRRIPQRRRLRPATPSPAANATPKQDERHARRHSTFTRCAHTPNIPFYQR